MKIIFKYILKYKIFFLLNFISIILISCGEIIIPYIIGKYVINNVDYMKEHFIKMILILCFLVILAFTGHLIINFCSAKISSLIFKDLSTLIFSKIQNFSITEIKNIGVSKLMNRTTTNIYQIMSFVSNFYKSAIISPIMLIISLFCIYLISFKLAYTIFITIPFFIFMLFFLVKKNYNLSMKQQQKAEEINSIIRQNILGIKVIKSLNQEKYEKKKFEKINSKYKKLIINFFISMVSIEPLFYLLLNTSIILTTGIGATLIKKNAYNDTGLKIGDLYNCINLQYHVLFSILNFLLLFMMFPKTLICVKNLEQILNTQTENLNKYLEKEKIGKIKKLEFKNVCFKYPDSQKMILEDINFEVNSSELIAFVGKTGSGKTTLVNLIPRLIEPTKGQIQINGINITNFNINKLREKIGFVSQKNILFKGTIFSNLLFGKKNASEIEMLEKAEIAQAHEFIKSKKNQLKEEISELGLNLSGGQKQRLSLTRAFLKEPDIYIFDDSFSALDYKTDSIIRKTLLNKIKNSIIIIVAQRLSSIEKADKIVVLVDGKIVNIGKHEELIKKCKIYQDIAFSQRIKEVL
ncbi:MAG: ABC-type multidrug/protein/lipid transport system ATP-binding and permease protein [Candidatus Phytoplasma cynodontis]|uniref:ABC transporter ATP-binding protein n=1 Tax='Cynodon dactylon' phytoplasma TaxID=295320 RepID=UPI001265CD48|nr:ABC transporter ATP-binding protein ['Cynodon dactylon' phytoplasma]KAB8122104.1 ABC transporter ATP-binding protein ['Cynodon dactylon' phytoplasma]WIA07888.1 MAG: ABC-type multidrug/protein/lipid transport system ATP-binding and permease protein [Candidatus Phytoplasma cynodontis]